MREGLILPDNIVDQDLTFIDKMDLKEKDLYVSDRKIPLSEFRYLYKKDKKLFDITAKESSLRGGFFVIDKQSPLFPNNQISNKDLIIVVPENINKDAFKKIDFSIVRLENVMREFEIKSNKFYQGIPLQGFLNLNLTNLELKILTEEFIMAGFEIVNKGTLDTQILNKKDITNKDFNKVISIYENSFYLSSNLNLSDIVSERWISELHKSNVHSIKDLCSIKGDTFFNFLSVDERKEILKELSKFYKNHSLMSKHAYRLVKTAIRLNKDILLSTLFSGSNWNLIRNIFYKSKKKYLTELQIEDFISLFNQKGIGIGKMVGILDEIYLYVGTGVSEDAVVLEISENKLENSLEYPKYFPYNWFSSPEFFDFLLLQKKFLFTKAELILLLEETTLKGKKKKNYIDIIEKMITEEKGTWEDSFLEKHSISLQSIFEIYGFSKDFEENNEEQVTDEILESSSDFLYKKYRESNSYIYHIVDFYYEQINMLMNLDNKITDILNDEKNQIVFQERIINGKTLEQVGEVLGVTRERVRQLEKKQFNILNNLLLCNGYKIIDYRVRKEQVIHRNFFELSNLVWRVLKYLRENLDIKIIEDCGEMVSKELIEVINVFKNYIRNIISIKGYILEKEILEWINYQLLGITKNFFLDNKNRFITEMGLIIFDDCYIEEKVSKADFSILIVDKYFDNKTIDLSNEEDFTLFSTYFDRLFKESSEKFTDASRNISSYFERKTDKIVKINPTVFKVINIDDLPVKLIDDVVKYAKMVLETEPTVYLRKISQQFSNLLILNNISDHEIYYYLKLFYSDIFDFGEKNTMRFYLKGSPKLSTEEIIISKVIDLGNEVHGTILSEVLGIERYTIDQAIIRSNRLISINGFVKYVDDKRIIVPKILEDEIKKISDRMLAQYGYIIINVIFEELRFDIKSSDLMMNAGLTDSEKFRNVLKVLNPNLKGHTKFLFPKESPVDTLTIFLDQMDGNKYHRNDFFEVARDLGYADVTTNIYINQGIDKGILVPIDDVYLIHHDSFKITELILTKVQEFIDKSIEIKSYISCYKLTGFRRILPRLETFAWTPELIYYVATQWLGYNKVSIKGATYIIDPLLITSKDQEKTYNQLVIDSLRSYKGNMHEENIADYLAENGLIRSKNKQLPKCLFEDRVLQVDEIGFITLLKFN